MITFLPYPDFNATAQCLDWRRLGKQRVETYQLLLGMNDPENFGWKHHPAFKIWLGYSLALADYGIAICSEWINRGYKDNLLVKFFNFLPDHTYTSYDKPAWLGNEKFHASHRSVLLYKDYDWYSKFGWIEKPDVPINNRYGYLWPK